MLPLISSSTAAPIIAGSSSRLDRPPCLCYVPSASLLAASLRSFLTHTLTLPHPPSTPSTPSTTHPPHSIHNPPTPLHPQHKPGTLQRVLNNSGIYRILSGHLPWGDSPTVISHPLRAAPAPSSSAASSAADFATASATASLPGWVRARKVPAMSAVPPAGLEIVDADTSYSDPHSPLKDNRGIAASEVVVRTVTVHTTEDDDASTAAATAGPSSSSASTKPASYPQTYTRTYSYTHVRGVLRTGEHFSYNLMPLPSTQFDPDYGEFQLPYRTAHAPASATRAHCLWMNSRMWMWLTPRVLSCARFRCRLPLLSSLSPPRPAVHRRAAGPRPPRADRRAASRAPVRTATRRAKAACSSPRFGPLRRAVRRPRVVGQGAAPAPQWPLFPAVPRITRALRVPH